MFSTPIFKANNVIVNEYGEIRILNFTATKSQDALRPSFIAARESMKMFGHPPIEIMYTDNVADAPFLQECFPSLLEGVHPINPYSELPPLCIPTSIQPTLARTQEEIHNVMLCLFSDGSDIPEVNVAMDMEWSVSLNEYTRTVQSTGTVDVISLAFDNKVYILHITPFLQCDPPKLPHYLQLFLESSHVHKYGHKISADLKKLQRDVRSPKPYLGAIELEQLAKQHGLITKGRNSLQDLVGKILGEQLEKDQIARTNPGWQSKHLTQQLISYATLDIWATYRLMCHLSNAAVPGAVNHDAPEGTHVTIWTSDLSQIAAYGVLGDPASNSIDGDQIDKQSQVLVQVTSVAIPAAISPCYSKKSLADFGSVPFKLICFWAHLQTSPDTSPPLHIPQPQPLQPVSPAILSDLEGFEVQDQTEGVSSSSVATLELEPIPDDVTPELESAVVDLESQAIGTALLSQTSMQPYGRIYSRVLKDVWHLMDMIKVPSIHSLRHAYFLALCDALFQFDKEDRARLESYAVSHGFGGFECLLKIKPDFVV